MLSTMSGSQLNHPHVIFVQKYTYAPVLVSTMPPQATKDWLAILKKRAQDRGVYVDVDLDSRIFHFHLGRDPGVIGKVRYSEGKSRDYENDQGQKHIWHRYNRENEAIEQGSERKVANITLDVWEKEEYDPNDSHFIFLTEKLLLEETYSKGDQKIWIEGDGRYSGPLAKHVNDWNAIFEYASDSNSTSISVDSNNNSEKGLADNESASRGDTSGSVSESERTEVRVSEQFKQQAYERYDHRCPLSKIETKKLLTVSHVLGRSENPELAEDIENVLILDWTHHMAFDAGIWTFDESGRLWVNPRFDTESGSLIQSLVDRHGQKIEEMTLVADEYIQRHNDQLKWWPPR